MRRSIPLIAATLGLGLTLTACSSGSETPSNTPTPTPDATEPAPQLSGELDLWVDEERIKDMVGVAADFEADFGVKVNMTQKAFGDIKTDFLAQVPSGEGPDVIVGANDWTGEFVTNGVVSPVQLGEALGGLSDGGVAAFTADGALYGVPYAVENIALVRNNDLVSETPATFDELLAQNDETGAKYPIVLQQGEDGDAYHLYPFMTSFGISIFETNEDGTYAGKAGIGGAQGTAYAEWLAAQGEKGWLSPDIDGDIATNAFKNGETPYIVTGPWNVVGDEGRFAESGMNVSVLPLPPAGDKTSRPFAGFQGFFMSAESKNKVAANAFLSYLATVDVQQQLSAEGGRIPVATAAADKLDNELLKGFATVGIDAVSQPALPEMDGVWGNWGTTQMQIVTGAASDPAVAWTNLEETINGLFK